MASPSCLHDEARADDAELRRQRPRDAAHLRDEERRIALLPSRRSAARPRVSVPSEQRVFHGRATPVGPAPPVRRPHVDVKPPRSSSASNSRRSSFSLSATARARAPSPRASSPRRGRPAPPRRRARPRSSGRRRPRASSASAATSCRAAPRARLVVLRGQRVCGSEVSVLAAARVPAAKAQDVREDDRKNQEFAVEVARVGCQRFGGRGRRARALFVAGARGAAVLAAALFSWPAAQRGALFEAGVRARSAGFGCPGAEFRACSHPCGTGAAHSGIVIVYACCLQAAI